MTRRREDGSEWLDAVFGGAARAAREDKVKVNAVYERTIRQLANDDAATLFAGGNGLRPTPEMAFEVVSAACESDAPVAVAIKELGARADEIYFDEWDRILHVDRRPMFSEAEAKERWTVVIGDPAATATIDPKNPHDWESLAYGFFLAFGFNPYTAQRLAREVA